MIDRGVYMSEYTRIHVGYLSGFWFVVDGLCGGLGWDTVSIWRVVFWLSIYMSHGG